MSKLDNLFNLTPNKKPSKSNPIVFRRNKLLRGINKQIQNHDNVFVFGCHITTQQLISFGLDTSKVTNILDNDTNKQGNFLYGTKLMTVSPKILESYENACVVVKMGVYTDEIVIGLREINSNLEIIT